MNLVNCSGGFHHISIKVCTDITHYLCVAINCSDGAFNFLHGIVKITRQLGNFIIAGKWEPYTEIAFSFGNFPQRITGTLQRLRYHITH